MISKEYKCPMPYTRLDICEAHFLIERHYHESGILKERQSNIRRNMSTDFQLSRMGFKPKQDFKYPHLTDAGKWIYSNLKRRYGFEPGAGYQDAGHQDYQNNCAMHAVGYHDMDGPFPLDGE